jgi:biotin carboxyl carrier protein
VQPVVAHAVTAPMPGTVLRIFVTHGTLVSRGDTVVILEAMKMELPIAALDDAIVVAVRCKEGDLVEAEATLVEFAPRPTT